MQRRAAGGGSAEDAPGASAVIQKGWGAVGRLVEGLVGVCMYRMMLLCDDAVTRRDGADAGRIESDGQTYVAVCLSWRCFCNASFRTTWVCAHALMVLNHQSQKHLPTVSCVVVRLANPTLFQLLYGVVCCWSRPTASGTVEKLQERADYAGTTLMHSGDEYIDEEARVCHREERRGQCVGRGGDGCVDVLMAYRLSRAPPAVVQPAGLGCEASTATSRSARE